MWIQRYKIYIVQWVSFEAKCCRKRNKFESYSVCTPQENNEIPFYLRLLAQLTNFLKKEREQPFFFSCACRLQSLGTFIFQIASYFYCFAYLPTGNLITSSLGVRCERCCGNYGLTLADARSATNYASEPVWVWETYRKFVPAREAACWWVVFRSCFHHAIFISISDCSRRYIIVSISHYWQITGRTRRWQLILSHLCIYSLRLQ